MLKSKRSVHSIETIFVVVSSSTTIKTKTPAGVLTFAELQLVENGSLSGGIETHHQDTHLLLAEL